MACEKHRRVARQFLEGLSTDELNYIAEFLGSCTLESRRPCDMSRLQLSDAIEQFNRSRRIKLRDPEHKMILLFEYICRSQPAPLVLVVRAGQR